MGVAERIVELRKLHKCTQETFAKKIGVTRSALSQYELGTRNPDYDTIERIADICSVSIDYLMGRTDKPNQVLADPVRKLIDSLDLTDEEIIRDIKFEVDGMVLEEDDVRRFVAFVRAERAMKKQVPVSEQSKQ